MKKRWFIRTVCIALFSLYSYSVPAQEVPGPKIVLNEREFDFMEVEEGRVVKHTFRVLNEGTETLEIKKVAPG